MGVQIALLRGIRAGASPDELLLVDSQNAEVYRLNLTEGRLRVVAGRLQTQPLTAASARGHLATDLPMPGINDVAIDHASGDVFAALLTGNTVLRISASDGAASVVAGTGEAGCSAASAAAGQAALTRLGHPSCAALDGRGGLVICDHDCCLLRRLDLATGALSVLAGACMVEGGQAAISRAGRSKALGPHPRLPSTLAGYAGVGQCAGPRNGSVPVSPGVTSVPTPFVYEPHFAAVDPRTGDVWWTEDLGLRVLLLRGGVPGGPVLRVAGSGLQGTDTSGTVPAGSLALNTALAYPNTITLDARGVPYFIDGSFPGRIVRLLATGVLEAVFLPAYSPSQSAASIDGPAIGFGATANWLNGLAFVDGGAGLLVADSFFTAVVRRVDLANGTVARVAGALDGGSGDGHAPPLSAAFAQLSALAVFPGGNNYLVADLGTTLMRVVLASPSAPAFCPAGDEQGEVGAAEGSAALSPLSPVHSRRLHVPLRHAAALLRPCAVLPRSHAAPPGCRARLLRRRVDVCDGRGGLRGAGGLPHWLLLRGRRAAALQSWYLRRCAAAGGSVRVRRLPARLVQ